MNALKMQLRKRQKSPEDLPMHWQYSWGCRSRLCRRAWRSCRRVSFFMPIRPGRKCSSMQTGGRSRVTRSGRVHPLEFFFCTGWPRARRMARREWMPGAAKMRTGVTTEPSDSFRSTRDKLPACAGTNYQVVRTRDISGDKSRLEERLREAQSARRRSAGWPAGWLTTSTICSPASCCTATS